MSMADVRAAFILAGGGDLSLTDAAMRHVGEGAHVLQFVGAHRDGARFDHISPPFRGDPDQRAREIAAELIRARADEPASGEYPARALIEWPRWAHPRIKSGVASAAAATVINQQEDRSMPAPAPIAGLASTLRDHLREATARADQVARRAKESVSNLHQVLDAAEGTVQQLDAAAADIQAALGLSTNGGPPLDPSNHDD
jgi:hypothetical protein